MRMHIALSANERYMPGATVAAAGVAVNAQAESELTFHLFTEGVKEQTFAEFAAVLRRLHAKSTVVEHKCDESVLKGLPYWAGSRMAAVRCHYATLMPEVDWCLYLDCDVLYLARVEEHFSYRDESAYACVVKEESDRTRQEECEWIEKACGIKIPNERYFNSGVVLFNFKKMREDGIPAKLVEFFKAHPKVPSPDQDALNATFANNVKLIPQKFDRLQIFLKEKDLETRPVIHYVVGNPWLRKYGCVANWRFRMWHRFADTHVYEKRGESYRRCFTKKMLAAKFACYYLLKCPLIGRMFAWGMEKAGICINAEVWRTTQIGMV